MGKPTGFLEYKRETAKVEAPKDRIKHFNEFRTPLKKWASIILPASFYAFFQGIYPRLSVCRREGVPLSIAALKR